MTMGEISVTDQYCDPLGDWNLVGFSKLLNNSQTVNNKSVLMLGARVSKK